MSEQYLIRDYVVPSIGKSNPSVITHDQSFHVALTKTLLIKRKAAFHRLLSPCRRRHDVSLPHFLIRYKSNYTNS